MPSNSFEKNITLTTSDNFRLDAMFSDMKGSSRVVVFAHGMTVDKDDEGIFVSAAQKLNDVGISTLKFDFRAHGLSSGTPENDFTISGELRDLHTAVQYLEQKGFTWIGLAGASFGGSIVALHLRYYPKRYRAIFLANPVLDYEKAFINPTTPWAREYFSNVLQRVNKNGFIEVGSSRFKLGKELFSQMRKNHPLTALSKYKGPLTVVHGDKDTKINYHDVKQDLESIGRKLIVIHGAEHGFHDEVYEEEVSGMVVECFFS